jgi:hypothetical protein
VPELFALPRRLEDLFEQGRVLHRFTYLATRAVKIDPMLPLFRALLEDDGRALLFRAHALDPKTVAEGKSLCLKLVKEVRYSLPFGFGERVISVLAAT